MTGQSTDPALRPARVETAGDDAADAPAITVRRLLRVLAGLVILLGGVAVLARWLRPELESIGGAFVERFGLLGMALGTFIADGFHFPVPPQFYMLLGIASKTSTLATLAAITGGSLAGGTVGYFFARRLARIRFVARWLDRSSKVVARFGSAHGYRLVILLSLTPVAFSVLCYLSGAYGLPKRVYALLAVFRIPKLVAYYYLVRMGWSFG